MCFTVATREGHGPWEILAQQWLSYVTVICFMTTLGATKEHNKKYPELVGGCPFSLQFRWEKIKPHASGDLLLKKCLCLITRA